jgi:regulator of replication initiation timing
MTDDIVARLRAGKFNWDCDEAADEIERLRAEIQQLKHDSTIFINERSDAICENFDLREENAELREMKADWRAAMTENHDLWRENERLRAALREIEECNQDPRLSRQSCVEQLQSMARAALEGEKTNETD